MVVCSPTYDFQDTWDPIRKLIDLDHDSVPAVLNYIKKAINKGLEDDKRKKGTRLKTKRLIIFDDVSAEKALNQGSKGLLNQFFYNARHWNMSLLVICHGVSTIGGGLRGNSENLVLFNTLNRDELHKLQKNFGIAKTRKEAEFLYDKEIWESIQSGRDTHPFLYFDLAAGGIPYFKFQERLNTLIKDKEEVPTKKRKREEESQETNPPDPDVPQNRKRKRRKSHH